MVGLTRLSDHDRPLPRDVPAFAAAEAAGLVPLRPTAPPDPSVHPTAAARQRVVALAAVGGTTLVVLAGLAVLGSDPSAGRTGLVGATCLVLLVVLAGLWHWLGRAALTELQRGYTTTTLVFGSYGLPVLRRYLSYGDRPPWDYAGVWRVGPVADGEVPDPSHDPPGFYPSPTRDGQFELWSGQVWVGVFRGPGDLPPRDALGAV